MADSPLDGLLVVNDQGVVTGFLSAAGTAGRTGQTVGEAMDEGPTTVRPSEDVGSLRHRMNHAGVAALPVTRPDGVLVGAVVAH